MANEKQDLQSFETEKYQIEVYIQRDNHEIILMEFIPKEFRRIPPEEIRPILENIGKWEKLTGIVKDLFNEIVVR